MKYLVLETFTDFKCIGSECPLTCCAGGWRIIIDSETDRYYKTVSGEFGKRLEDAVTEENGQRYFILNEDGICSFLNKEKLCDIYLKLGEEHMCFTCASYPRYYFDVGDITFAGVTISCPEVARLVINHQDPLRIDFSEDDKKYETKERVDWEVFNYTIRAFTTAVSIAQDRELAIGERLAVLTTFVYQFQSYIDDKRDPSSLTDLFSNHSNFNLILPQTGIYNRNLNSKVQFYSQSIGFLSSIDRFKELFPELYELKEYFESDGSMILNRDAVISAYQAFDLKETQIWVEHLLVYALHRYFMQGFSKKNFYTHYLVGILLIFEFSIATVAIYHVRWGHFPAIEDIVMIVSHTSRAVEHDDTFRDKLIDHFKSEEMTEPSFLFKLFS